MYETSPATFSTLYLHCLVLVLLKIQNKWFLSIINLDNFSILKFVKHTGFAKQLYFFLIEHKPFYSYYTSRVMLPLCHLSVSKRTAQELDDIYMHLPEL